MNKLLLVSASILFVLLFIGCDTLAKTYKYGELVDKSCRACGRGTLKYVVDGCSRNTLVVVCPVCGFRAFEQRADFNENK